MKIKELIEVLERQPPEMMVMVDGYEGGYESEIYVKEKSVVKQSLDLSYEGDYKDSEGEEDGTLVIIVSREEY